MNKSLSALFTIPLLAMVACASAQGGKPGASFDSNRILLAAHADLA